MPSQAEVKSALPLGLLGLADEVSKIGKKRQCRVYRKVMVEWGRSFKTEVSEVLEQGHTSRAELHTSGKSTLGMLLSPRRDRMFDNRTSNDHASVSVLHELDPV